MSDTDFPRVFFLMHKWFMESETLANMLYNMYLKYDNDSQNKLETYNILPETVKSIENNEQNNENVKNFNEDEQSKHSLNSNTQKTIDYQLKICHAFR